MIRNGSYLKVKLSRMTELYSLHARLSLHLFAKWPFAKAYIYYSEVHCQVHIVFTESLLSRATTMGTEISHRVWSTHGRVLVSHFVPHHQRGSCH